MAYCKGCGREIIWIKKMPCDPLPVAYWTSPQGRGKVVTTDGKVVRCEFRGNMQRASGIGYIAHWATCPAADQFRKRRRT